MTYLEKISNFDENNLPSLDEVVLWALELFEKWNLEKLNINKFEKPLIAGSWNAIVTAEIIFSWTDAIFCDETNFDTYINKKIDWLIILSASWEKHANIFAKKAINKWIEVKLLTCNQNSSAMNIIWKKNTTITKKNREPYTYNTSTYLWWILAITWEEANLIKNHIQEYIDPIINNIDFSKYDSYLLITPNKFSSVNQLFIVKFIELFWRKIARDVFSYEQFKHAITVIPHKTELAISFWEWEFFYEWNQIHIPLDINCNIWWMMAIGYYVIWKIQNSYPHYFKENIWKYIKDVNNTEFWKWLKVIVE